MERRSQNICLYSHILFFSFNVGGDNSLQRSSLYITYIYIQLFVIKQDLPCPTTVLLFYASLVYLCVFSVFFFMCLINLINSQPHHFLRFDSCLDLAIFVCCLFWVVFITENSQYNYLDTLLWIFVAFCSM